MIIERTNKAIEDVANFLGVKIKDVDTQVKGNNLVVELSAFDTFTVEWYRYNFYVDKDTPQSNKQLRRFIVENIYYSISVVD